MTALLQGSIVEVYTPLIAHLCLHLNCVWMEQLLTMSWNLVSYSLGILLYVIHTCNLLMQERFAESCVPDGAYTIQWDEFFTGYLFNTTVDVAFMSFEDWALLSLAFELSCTDSDFCWGYELVEDPDCSSALLNSWWANWISQLKKRKQAECFQNPFAPPLWFKKICRYMNFKKKCGDGRACP